VTRPMAKPITPVMVMDSQKNEENSLGLLETSTCGWFVVGRYDEYRRERIYVAPFLQPRRSRWLGFQERRGVLVGCRAFVKLLSDV